MTEPAQQGVVEQQTSCVYGALVCLGFGLLASSEVAVGSHLKAVAVLGVVLVHTGVVVWIALSKHSIHYTN